MAENDRREAVTTQVTFINTVKVGYDLDRRRVALTIPHHGAFSFDVELTEKIAAALAEHAATLRKTTKRRVS